ncbi:MAG: PadR family transcriptional regulator [Candidatus Korarchaeota archaeon]|nr:PadR family transcriptional regulator [Candidatus Korarchaeota archaeon]
MRVGPCKPGPFGLMPLLILKMAYEGPVHGYQIIEKVKDMTLGGYVPETGAIYTTLRRMEKRGLLTSKWESGTGRRIYEITEGGIIALKEGLKVLAARREIFEELFRFYEEMWGDKGGGGD